MQIQGQRQRDDRPYFRKVDFVFYHEKLIRDAVEDARNDFNVPEIRTGSGTPDPTAKQAIFNLSDISAVRIEGEELKYPERWLIVVDKTYAWCKRQKGLHFEIAKRRYSGESYKKTCWELCVDHTTISRTMEKVRIYAALQAAQMNLIYVE